MGEEGRRFSNHWSAADITCILEIIQYELKLFLAPLRVCPWPHGGLRDTCCSRAGSCFGDSCGGHPNSALVAMLPFRWEDQMLVVSEDMSVRIVACRSKTNKGLAAGSEGTMTET